MAYRCIIGGLLVFACAYLIATTQIALDPWSEADAFNSRTLPYLYGTLLTVGLIGLLLKSYFQKTTSPALPTNLTALCLLLAAAIVFVLVLPYLGFWIALSGLLGTGIVILGERRWWAVTGVAAAMPVSGWLIIEYALGIVIPL